MSEATYRVDIRLDVAEEPRMMTATKEMDTEAEVVAAVTDFLCKFVAPDHGPQVINITIASGPLDS